MNPYDWMRTDGLASWNNNKSIKTLFEPIDGIECLHQLILLNFDPRSRDVRVAVQWFRWMGKCVRKQHFGNPYAQVNEEISPKTPEKALN